MHGAKNVKIPVSVMTTICLKMLRELIAETVCRLNILQTISIYSKIFPLFVVTVKSPFDVHVRFFPLLIFNLSSRTTDITHEFPPLEIFSI